MNYPLQLPWAEIRPEVAAGPASSPPSVAEDVSSVSQLLVSRDFLSKAVYVLDNLFSLFKRKNLRKGGGCGRLFLSWGLLQGSGVLPGFKHCIYNTVKNNPLAERKAWERG